jgi:hypothetical protein
MGQKMNTAKYKAALDVRFDSDAGDGLTVRGVFRTLLTNLWSEQEFFSTKRPFGDFGWDYDWEVPEPLRVAPELNAHYWYSSDGRVCSDLWGTYGTAAGDRRLADGVVHLTEDAATQHRDALTAINNQPGH